MYGYWGRHMGYPGWRFRRHAWRHHGWGHHYW